MLANRRGCIRGTARAVSRGMQDLDRDMLSAVVGGEDVATPASGPVQDENTGACGLGPYSYGQTRECKAHDDCVGKWAQSVGRPAADAICAPLLPAAVASAARCAVDPFCPK